MKKILLFAAILLGLCLLSGACKKKDVLLHTTFSGRAFDVARNKAVPGFGVEVDWYFRCTSGSFPLGTCSETAGSAITDASGNFSMEFDAIPGGDYDLSTANQMNYRRDIVTGGSIVPGYNNTISLDVWYPVILKASFNIINSIYPPLAINTYANNNSLWNESIYGGPSITKTLYLRAKPKTVNTITFSYSNPSQPNILHLKRDSLFVNTQDTMDISFNIDCSTF